MAKDVNIHIKTPGAQEAKQQLGGVGDAAKRVGQKTQKGQQKAADSTKQASKELSGMGRVLSNLKTQVMGFIGAWSGFQGVQKLITWLIQKLERIQQLQADIYQQSIRLSELGQALEFQTGTQGQQQYWTQQALALQKAGGLESPQVAQQMMISADIAFAAQGGVKSQEIQNLLKQLSPFFASAGLGPSEVAKVFEFAGTAGVEPTPQAYKQFLSRLQAGFTASKATSFGEFMVGLQKGGTAYMSMGGTLPEAMSTFAGARAVMANEALAATLLEQLSRLSSGAYARPRAAIEKTLGVQWGQLSTDQRLQALLTYVGGIPEAQRGEILAAQGFPLELTSQIGKMVSPEAKRTMVASRQKVLGATPRAAEDMIAAYMQSDLARQRIIDAEHSIRQVEAGPDFAAWQRRLNKAKAEHEILMTQSKDRRILDKHEPTVMALESLMNDIWTAREAATSEEEKERLFSLHTKAEMYKSRMAGKGAWWGMFTPKVMGIVGGQRVEEQFQNYLSQPATIVHDHSINYYPRVGPDGSGPRVGRDVK